MTKAGKATKNTPAILSETFRNDHTPDTTSSAPRPYISLGKSHHTVDIMCHPWSLSADVPSVDVRSARTWNNCPAAEL